MSICAGKSCTAEEMLTIIPRPLCVCVSGGHGVKGRRKERREGRVGERGEKGTKGERSIRRQVMKERKGKSRGGGRGEEKWRGRGNRTEMGVRACVRAVTVTTHLSTIFGSSI